METEDTRGRWAKINGDGCPKVEVSGLTNCPPGPGEGMGGGIAFFILLNVFKGNKAESGIIHHK